MKDSRNSMKKREFIKSLAAGAASLPFLELEAKPRHSLSKEDIDELFRKIRRINENTAPKIHSLDAHFFRSCFEGC